MKKGLAIIFCVLLLAACAAPQSAGQKGVEETAVFVNPNAVKAGAYGALYFEANGYRFGIYDKMEDVLAHVPSNTTFTGESCAFEGDDIYYFFNGFEIMANVIDGAERVTAITIVNDTVKTPSGLFIGMAEDDARAILNVAPGASGIYTVVDGTAQLNVTVQDGTVRAISYIAAG